MARNKLDHEEYAPSFSGHETFPLKYGWLKKVYDAVSSKENSNGLDASPALFKSDEAIATFGVGKNMVFSMEHWALSTGIIKKEKANISISELGHFIFGKDGRDPYLENPNTLWLLHWILTRSPKKTLNYYLFNLYNKPSFNKDRLKDAVDILFLEHPNWRDTSSNTIGRDIDCLIGSYTNKIGNKKTTHEDSIECPFAELSIIVRQNQNDFRITRTHRETLDDALFAYALIDFWSSYSSAQTMTFETILHREGSPGKIFCLSEDDLSERIIKLEDTTKGTLIWSQSAGLRQVIASSPLREINATEYIKKVYR